MNKFMSQLKDQLFYFWGYKFSILYWFFIIFSIVSHYSINENLLLAILNGVYEGTSTASVGKFTIDDVNVPATSVKTWNGLVRASVKTVNGLAIASVKTINGLT